MKKNGQGNKKTVIDYVLTKDDKFIRKMTIDEAKNFSVQHTRHEEEIQKTVYSDHNAKKHKLTGKKS